MADGQPTPAAATTPTATRRAIGMLAGVAGVVAAVLVVAFFLRGDGEPEPARFEHTFPSEYIGTVWITVAAADDDERTVELEWARLATTVPHRGTQTYYFVRGVGRRALPAPAGPGSAYWPRRPSGTARTRPTVDIGATAWRVLPGTRAPRRSARPTPSPAPPPPPSTRPAPTAGPPSTTASACAPGPQLEEPAFARVKHGVELTTDCWVEGQEITTGNNADPSDDDATYTTTIWWRLRWTVRPASSPTPGFRAAATATR